MNHRTIGCSPFNCKKREKRMKRLHALGGIATVLVLLSFMCAPALAMQDIGKVITFTPGASVLRDGKTEPLAMHAGIRVSDTVQTDAGGRVKILFNDDSSVSLGPNTTMDMEEYADAGAKSSFAVNVPHGMARAITGKIVEQNPNGFKMSSPEATVGIRGTIVTMRVERGQGNQRGSTTVFVENTLRNVYVNGGNVPSGNKWISDGGSGRQERITPEDRRHIGRELAFHGGGGSAAAAPEAGEGRGRRRATEQFVPAGGSIVPEDGLKDDDRVPQSLLAPYITPVGHVSGSLDSISFSGSFNFTVNLSSGKITNGQMKLDGIIPLTAGNAFILGGGTGLANASGFRMDAPLGARYYNALFNSSASGWVENNGPVNLLTAPSGNQFNVNYGVSSSGGMSDSGTGTGTITK